MFYQNEVKESERVPHVFHCVTHFLKCPSSPQDLFSVVSFSLVNFFPVCVVHTAFFFLCDLSLPLTPPETPLTSFFSFIAPASFSCQFAVWPQRDIQGQLSCGSYRLWLQHVTVTDLSDNRVMRLLRCASSQKNTLKKRKIIYTSIMVMAVLPLKIPPNKKTKQTSSNVNI